MEFEQQLKQRIEKNLNNDLEQIPIIFNEGNIIAESTKKVFQNFIDIIDTYNFEKYGNSKTDDEIFEMGDNFQKLLTEEKISEMYKRIQFTEEEKTYIKYTDLSKNGENIVAFL